MSIDVKQTLKNSASFIFNKVFDLIKNSWLNFKESIARVSSDSVEWVGILALHGATIPTLLGLMTGITDTTPPIDIVLILWAALTMFFIKAVIKKDLLNILTIGLGFIGQATAMALIFFK